MRNPSIIEPEPFEFIGEQVWNDEGQWNFEDPGGAKPLYVPIPGRQYGPKWRSTRPHGLPADARQASSPGEAMPFIVQAAIAKNLGDTFIKLMGDLARTESNSTFGLPANTFDARPEAERPAGKARITAWGVYQFNRPAWCALNGYGASNCPPDLMPWRATPVEEVQKPINRYAEVFSSVRNAGGSDLDAARGVRLWQRSPSVEFRQYLERGRKSGNFAAAWQQVGASHRAAVDARLRKVGMLPAQELSFEAEDESSVGGLTSYFGSGVESALVRSAIRSGTTNENALADLIFFRRHPERKGRAISRSESNFQQLSGEWLTIRDSIVRPALRGTAPTPPTSPSPSPTPAPTPPSSPACTAQWPASKIVALRQRIVTVASAEWKWWNFGQLQEDDPDAFDRLVEYWLAVPNMTTSQAADYVRRRIAWSAAFISWVMRQAGAGSDFVYSSYHSTYLAAAYQNRRNSGCSPFKAYGINEVVPQPGDLVVRTYESVPTNLDLVRPGTSGYHSNIVIKIESGKLTTIGGNNTDSVKPPGPEVKIDARGFVTAPDFAVIKVA